MLRVAASAVALLLVAPGGSAPRPKARKGVATKTKARSSARPTTQRRAPRLGKRLRKGKVPGSRLRVRHGLVASPSKKLVGSKRARKPLRLRSMPKPSKVSFAPCAASPPEHAPRHTVPKAGMDAAVVERRYQWPNGAELHIGFLDGSREAREAVAELAARWTEHANLTWKFHLGDAPRRADILIQFDSDGCTSALGTSSRYSAEVGDASMNLCHMDQRIGSDRFRRVVLHEFGHALGLHHEHQNPRVQHEWNKEAVYAYYGQQGWTRSYVDLWVFRRISPEVADTSEYDPDSVMHYAFPPEFTINGVGFGGKNELSAIDASFIAETYPGRGGTKGKRYYERRLSVRNETGRALDVQAIYETKSGRKNVWAPKSSLGAAPVVRVPAGAERVLDGPGRRAKIVARSSDGRATWGEWSTTPLRIAPVDGYLDHELQTYVAVIDGPADPPKGQTKAELYASANDALSDGRHVAARERFGEFVDRFPDDTLTPWAKFNVIVSWYESEHPEDARGDSYRLIVDHPAANATPYAWFYGGLASLRTGWCDGAQAYFEYAQTERSGLPKAWREIATEYLGAIAADRDRWCW